MRIRARGGCAIRVRQRRTPPLRGLVDDQRARVVRLLCIHNAHSSEIAERYVRMSWVRGGFSDSPRRIVGYQEFRFAVRR